MAMAMEKTGLQVAPELVDFIETEALPGTGRDADDFWNALATLAHDFSIFLGNSLTRKWVEAASDVQNKMTG
ncbi:MAG: hypothetical protein AAGF74_14060, partial [Pseudomonadota bacterium]